MPNDQLWRDIEDAGHMVQTFNGGQMLRIDDKVDIYGRSLKWRYTHAKNDFKPLTWVDKKKELLYILSNAPRTYIPTQHDDSPAISRGLLRAVKRYKKST